MKVSNIYFHENPSSGRRTDTRGRTDKTKQTGAFRNYVQAPKKSEWGEEIMIV